MDELQDKIQQIISVVEKITIDVNDLTKTTTQLSTRVDMLEDIIQKLQADVNNLQSYNSESKQVIGELQGSVRQMLDSTSKLWRLNIAIIIAVITSILARFIP